MMLRSDYLSFSWEDLIKTARSSLAEGDVEQLKQLDAVFRYRFCTQVRRGNTSSKDEFVEHLLGVTESTAAREIEAPTELQRLLCRWEHLEVLLDALRADGDLVDEAERLVHSRKHAGALLDAVAGATGWGIQAGELAGKLGISPQHLASLLRDLEQQDVVERSKVGKHVYVCPGLVGQQVLNRRQAARSHPVPTVHQEPQPEIPTDNDAMLLGFFCNPRECLMAPAA